MGTNHSSTFEFNSDPMQNESLLLFVQQIPITEDDHFWNTFLTFNMSKPIDTKEVDEELNIKIKPLCKMLFLNNLKSGNFPTVLKFVKNNVNHLINSANETVNKTHSNTIQLENYKVSNALFIIRCYMKYLVEHTNEKEILKHMKPPEILKSDLLNHYVTFEDYLQILTNLIIKLPVTDYTYDLHIEAIHSLIVVLSVTLFTSIPIIDQLIVYKFMMNFEEAEQLLQTLLRRYIEQLNRPNKSRGYLYNFTSDLWQFFSFHRQNSEDFDTPLSRISIILLLILLNHCTSLKNPYRLAISKYSANVNGVYKIICQTINHEENTLLLYHLLHTNTNFKNYFLARSDVELILLPVLKRIYNAADNNSHHIYMSLIILLILTEDSLFNKAIHSVILKGIPWYTEKMISEISLGGLIILVTARTIQFNLLRMRDKYLHTNCLAALANMSSQFSNLHTYVCQRIISLFEVLTKTHSKSNVDTMAIEETMRIILEVINSCLCHKLLHNTNLVYTLLYNKHIFQNFRNHEAFRDIIQNIDLVITYFSKKIEKESEFCSNVDEIHEKIQRWSHQWPSDLMKKFPDLKFKYVEEEKPDEFFIPYVWSLAGKYSGIHWNSALYNL